jgi:signal transduction histidine kinase
MNEAALLDEKMANFNRSAARLSQAYARLAEKFSGLDGKLAAEIAHEIRNPLGSIKLFASLLVRDLAEERDRERAAQIVTAAKNLEEAVAALLRAANVAEHPCREIDVHGILRDILLDSQEMADERGLFLSARYASGSPCITGEMEMMRQVFLNLICHFLQAIGEGGCLLIETRMIGGEDRRTSGISSVEVRFSESGVEAGECRGSPFLDAFFPAKERDLGLGFAIVNSIVQRYGGSVHVQIGEGGRAAFSIVLPLSGYVPLD